MSRRKILRHAMATLAATSVPIAGCDAPRSATATGQGSDPRSRRLAQGSAGGAGLGVPSDAELNATASSWIPWTEPTAGGPTPLLVTAGSALDLSSMATEPVSSRIGKRGLGFNLLGFRLPSVAEIPSFVSAVKRNGHAFIRFFGLDPWFGQGSTVFPPGDTYGCAYDAKAVDLWWRYLAALSDAGIQYSVEFLYLASGMLAGRKAWPDSPDPASQSMVLRASLNEANAVSHWKHCFEVLCNRPNPHFAKPRKIVNDTNCLFIGTANENNLWNRGLYFLGRGAADVAAFMQPYFDRWQSANGGSSHQVPPVGGGSAAASTAFGRFLLDVHADSYEAMRSHARSAGFAGKMSAVNYVPNVFDGILRAETLDMVDCHMYFDLDDNGVGSANRSMIGDRFYNASWLASGFVHGKRAVTADTALRLARFFGTSERFWLNLQTAHDLDVERDRLGARLPREVLVLKKAS